MSRLVSLLLAVLLGLAIGFVLWGDRSERAAAPDDWVARIGDRYISVEEFAEELRLRGGNHRGTRRPPGGNYWL